MLDQRRLRILYLDPAGQLWGSEQSLLLLLKHIDRHEFQPFLCLPPKTPLIRKAHEINVSSLPYFRGNLHCGATFSLKKLTAIMGLIRATFRVRPDLIHLNQAGAIRYVLFLKRFFPYPLVLHVRLAEDAALVSKHIRTFSRTKLIANSNFVCDRLLENQVNPTILHTVYNPIEIEDEDTNDDVKTTESLISREIDLSGYQHIVGFVGRISEDKGINLYLHGMQEVIKQRPSTLGMVIGDTANKKDPMGGNYLGLMKNLASQLGISDQVTFLGFREDARQLMKVFKVFVMPSHEEPWGRVICESLIAGTPVVATNAGGAREIIESGKSGLLVPLNNPKALAKAIIQFLDAPDLAKKMVRKGREWVKDHCDPQKHANAMMEIYHSFGL